MAATSTNSRSSRSARTRLPLTPKVTSARRGVHAVVPTAAVEQAPAGAASTPAFHLTPNVVSAVRGGTKLEGTESLAKALRSTPRRGPFAV